MQTTKSNDVKAEIKKTLEALQSLRDEAKMKLHLAKLDAKDAWAKLEPRIAEAERIAENATEEALRTIRKTTQQVEKLIGSL